MEVASYDICFKANEHAALADIFDRSTYYVYIEDGDRSLYDDKDIFLGEFAPEFGFIRRYVPTAVAKRTNPPFHELIPAPSTDEILEAFKSLRGFGVKGEVIFKMDTGSYSTKATFFRFLSSTDKTMKKNVSITFEADDTITDKLMELLIKVANEYLDPMTGEQK